MYFRQLEDRYLPLIQKGLPERQAPAKKVVILGAGMAGLVAAYELRQAGHQVQILEAQSRVGGRIYTLRAAIEIHLA